MSRIPSPQEVGFVASQEENALFEQLWRLGSNEDVMRASNAASLLQKSKLPKEQLKEVWNAVDQFKNGTLDRVGWWRACKLVASLQNNGGMQIRRMYSTYCELGTNVTQKHLCLNLKVSPHNYNQMNYSAEKKDRSGLHCFKITPKMASSLVTWQEIYS
jgi:hypothetical protein